LTTEERLRHHRHISAARAALGDDAAFNRAWQQGRAQSLEQAIEISLKALVDRG